MAHTASLSPAPAHVPTQAAPRPAGRMTAETDPGPWLALVVVSTLFLTVVAVSWLSMMSF